jgi:hypoxanthine phosphoribosyltransferase
MYNYTYDQWMMDRPQIIDLIAKIDSPHLVSIYRGSLGIGAELSNVTKLPLSIGKYQSRDGSDKEFTLPINAGIAFKDSIVILDDILDTGHTISKAFEFFRRVFPSNPLFVITIYGKESQFNNYFIHLHTDEWIEFYWEK